MPGEQVNVALGHPPLPAYPGQAMDEHHIYLASETASAIFWSTGRSNMSPLPYSSAAPMMVYPARFA